MATNEVAKITLCFLH